MECIIEMFSGFNTRTRADLLAQLVTKNSSQKIQKNDKKAIVKESNHTQPKIDTIFKKKN